MLYIISVDSMYTNTTWGGFYRFSSRGVSECVMYLRECYNIPAQYFLFPFPFLNERNLCTIRSRGDSTSLLYVQLIVTHLES